MTSVGVSTPRFALVPVAVAPAIAARLGVAGVTPELAEASSTQLRNYVAASRSASRLPVRPPLVLQRFSRPGAAKRSAVAQVAKPRPGVRATRYGQARNRPMYQRPVAPTGSRFRGASVRHRSHQDSFDTGGLSAVIAYAWAQVGKSYVRGAEGPDAFDCSGFTMQAYRHAGLSLPHSSWAQAAMAHAVPLAEGRPGDLVVGVGHVGIYLGDGMMIDAGNSRVGVVYRELFDGLHIERF